MHVAPSPSDRIFFSRHADQRLQQRAPELGGDLDRIRDEIVEALLNRRYAHEWRALWRLWTRDLERVYIVAGHPRKRRIVVVTVLVPLLEQAA